MTTHGDDRPAIELEGLTKRFGRELAVDGLSLRVARGSTFGLIKLVVVSVKSLVKSKTAIRDLRPHKGARTISLGFEQLG